MAMMMRKAAAVPASSRRSVAVNSVSGKRTVSGKAGAPVPEDVLACEFLDFATSTAA